MASSELLPDYYAVLQVHPDADDEVIAAAYRQLMKKYHPDVAGEDPRRIADHLARSKALNEAFRVLRDANQRRHYDSARIFYRTQRPAPPPPGAYPTPPPRADGAAAAPAASPEPLVEYAIPGTQSLLLRPFALIAAAYYLLPGAYEWEGGRSSELLRAVLLPIVGIGTFALFTGRLARWIGSAPTATLVGAVLLLLLAIPLFAALPRVAAAAGPSVMLLSGPAGSTLQHAHVPVWLAWIVAGLVSLALSARLYVFAVIPTLTACWVMTCFS